MKWEDKARALRKLGACQLILNEDFTWTCSIRACDGLPEFCPTYFDKGKTPGEAVGRLFWDVEHTTWLYVNQTWEGYGKYHYDLRWKGDKWVQTKFPLTKSLE